SAFLTTSAAVALEPGSGTFRFDPKDDQKCGVADRYTMPACDFKFTLSLRHDLTCTGVRVYDLTFPSPIKTEIPENNIVHCELFLPPGEGPFPAAVVLDILQGNALIARGRGMWMPQHGVAGMVLHTPHYGPRRSPARKPRLISTDIPKTLDAIKQTVLDVRCAVAWLASRPEFDPNN